MNSNINVLKTVGEVHQFIGLGKPKHPLVTVFYHNRPDIMLSHGATRYTSDLYLIALKDGVTGAMTYGRSSYDYDDGTMIFVEPGQVMSSTDVNVNPNSQGWTLIFHPDLIRRSNLGKKIKEYSFFSYQTNEALHLSETERKILNQQVKKIEQEYEHSIDRHSQNLIVSNIELILDYCLRYYDRQFYLRTNQNKDTITRFQEFLNDYYNSDKLLHQGIPTVKQCGEALGMSWNYLSDLLKKESGKNAQEHIHYFLIEKAKTVLLNSTDNVGQVAYSLGFEYPQHFSRLFKKKTGMSPSEYRKLN